MSKPDFKLESPPASLPSVVSDREWALRVSKLIGTITYAKLGIWDQDFIRDVKGQCFFSPAQKRELRRIWEQWGHLV